MKILFLTEAEIEACEHALSNFLDGDEHDQAFFGNRGKVNNAISARRRLRTAVSSMTAISLLSTILRKESQE